MTTYDRFINFLQESGIEFEVEEYPFKSTNPTMKYRVEISNELVSPYGCICAWDFDENGEIMRIESE